MSAAISKASTHTASTSFAAKPILPGATIGIFGGGQLGRMTAMAARAMGYRILVLDPDPACPARFVVDGCIEAGWDDSREAANLARGCDVVTLEIEQISIGSMEAAASFAPVRPDRAMLAIIQDRIEQKDWLKRNHFPIGEYRAVRSREELREAVQALGGRCFCKSAKGGYDGRGQGKVGFVPTADFAAETQGAWEALGEEAGVVEQGRGSGAGNLRTGGPRTERRGEGLSRCLEPPRAPDPRMERHSRADPIGARISGAKHRRGDCGHFPARGHSCG